MISLTKYIKRYAGNNFYIFETIFILSTLLGSAVCSLVKCKSLEGSVEASRVYSE